MSDARSRQYFATLPPEEILDHIKQRWDDYQKWLYQSGFADRIRKSYATYYGLNKKGSLGIEKSVDGSIVYANMNMQKRLLTVQRQMITASKISYFARARVSNSDSLAASQIGRACADYYGETKKISHQLDKLVERAQVCHKAYIAVLWDPSAGQDVRPDVAPDGTVSDVMLKTGDIRLGLFTPFDVAESQSTSESPWRIVRERFNRYELMAQYPELARDILMCSDQPDIQQRLRYSMTFEAATTKDPDVVYKYTFFHEPTIACPDGLIVEYVGDTLMSYRPLAPVYKRIPVFKLSVGDIIDSVAAHGTSVDLLALQDVLNALLSAVVTNNVNLALTNLWTKDPDTKREKLAEGMYMFTGAEPPQSVALAQSSPETYKLIDLIMSLGSQTAGQNDLTDGTVSDTKLTSGNALAMLLTTAISFVSSIQRDYADVASDVMTQIIDNIRLNCKTEIVATIAGKSQRSFSKTFKAENLGGIDKIMVELQNPVMATQAGRTQVAEALAGMNMLDTPEDYVRVLTTGDLPGATDGKLTMTEMIEAENERLQEGEQVPVVMTDKHDTHYHEHLAVLNDPEARKDPNLVDNVLAHAQEHLNWWQKLTMTNPAMLAVLNIPPCPMPQMPPPPGAEGMPPPDQGAPQEGGDGAEMPQEESTLPSMPTLPSDAPAEAQDAYDNFQANVPPGAEPFTQ